jgi:predicted phosphodiesterase
VSVGRLLCCHATPTSLEDVVLPSTPREQVAEVDADAVAAGHVHEQWLRRFGRTLWFCVGAIGVSPHAEYALVDSNSLALEFRRISFDVDELLGAARAAEFPYLETWAAQWKL